MVEALRKCEGINGPQRVSGKASAEYMERRPALAAKSVFAFLFEWSVLQAIKVVPQNFLSL